MEMSYNKTRYLDRFMKLDNLTYDIISKEDIDDIKNVINFAEGLVIKDYDAAMKYETLAISTAADTYTSIVMDIGISDLTDLEKQTILKTYKEKNEYYLKLNTEYNIDYFTARQAKDFEILKATNNTLSDSDKTLFYQAYHETVDYYFQVLHTSGLKGEPLYKEYFRELVVFFAIQRYLTKKMERFFDIDRYTKTDCKNTFISYGLDYFDGLPLTYQRKLIKKINSIIQYKGTNKCFELILEAFGFDNIKISKYILAKDWKNNDVFFYKTPIDQAVNVETDEIATFEEVTAGDPLWQAEKEEILMHNFNTVESKYLSIGIFSDIVKNSSNTAYFASLLNAMESRFALYKDADAFSFVNTNISSKPIDLFNAIIAVVIMILKRNKFSTKINYSNIGKGIWGFGAISNNDKIEPFLRELRHEVINSEYWLEKTTSYSTLYEFFDTFALESFTQASVYTRDYIKSYYQQNDDVYEQLLRSSKYYAFNNITEKIEKGKGDAEYRLFDCLTFYSEKLILNKLDIMDFKKRFPELYNFLIKYNIYKYNDELKPFENFKRIIENNVIVETQLEMLLTNLNNIELNQMYVRNGFDIKCFMLLKDIINYNRKDILTAENIEQYRQVLKKDPCDVLYYDDLNCYFEMFTQFNIQQDTYYTIDEFMAILKYNLGLKEQLEEFILQTDNYNLYKNYMELWESAFVEPQNTNLYMVNGNSTWDEYLSKKDSSLYAYTKVPVSIEGDDEKEQEWYDTAIFELIESIDIFVNDPENNYFIENEFVGVSDFVRKYVSIALMIFKAYTTDILANEHNYIYDEPVFNTFRMFDECNIVGEECILTDCYDIQETHAETEICTMTEQIVYTETLKFNNIVFETNNMGELIKDVNGNYIEKYNFEEEEVKDITYYDINW